MITQQIQNQLIISQNKQFNRNMFEYKHVIGRGGFGKVWKVEMKKNKKVYALK